jgi:hypothetical protein
VTATLGGRLVVAACIGCGARSRNGECPGSCVDVPLDLVDAGAVDALGEHVQALAARVDALRALSREPEAPLPVLRHRARSALQAAVAPRDPDVPIWQGWGCTECGRIDAPQPCLGVCLRRPVLTADAGEYRRLEALADELAAEERELSRVARLVAHVNPRPGFEKETTDGLRALLAEM